MQDEKKLEIKEKQLEKKLDSIEKKEKQVEEKIEKQKKLLEKQVDVSRKLERRLRNEASQFKKVFAERTLKLVTSGFGLVAALAWNELIKEAVNMYIKPYFGKNSGLISLAIYAALVTALAVIVTYQLSKLTGDKED